ncbi:MAG TPA: thioredoxin family protein [Vicinamibacterales bacterium]|nr:thioredoxin family protein [Vicinamibacterales bacterium]
MPLVGADGVHAGDTVRTALTVTLPDGFHVQSNKPRDPLLIATQLTVDAPDGVTVKEIVFPAPIDLRQQNADQPLAVFQRSFAIGVQMAVAPSAATGSIKVPARLRYQACDDTTCFAPTNATAEWTLDVVPQSAATHAANRDVIDHIAFGHGDAPGSIAAPAVIVPPNRAGAAPSFDGFTVAGTTGGYQGSSDFLKFIHDAENGVKERGMFEGRGPLAILLLVFVGGLALNLTPCVLPMVPINLAIIGAGAQAGSRSRGFALGGVYGLAMAVVYGVLGLIVILTAGTFGTINASPWFNLGIAVLFVALALAMFDIITIDFSRFSSNFRIAEASRGTFIVAFVMGAVAALLAGACVAPVVIQVVLFSSNLYAKGTSVALALPFLLGVGMAVPWPVAGAGLAALPKPGAWMVRVKQVFGVVILATAAYYGYEAYGLFADRFVDPSAVTSSVDEQIKAGWHRQIDEGLEAAAREHKPVLIDMWATWCKNCLTMDKTTLQEPAVATALDGYVKIKFQAENPDEQPAKAVMQRFDVVGLPSYVILHPKP